MASMTELHDPIATMMDYKDTRQALERAISKLPDQRQKVFRLIKLENQSYEYAAKHFGVSVGTIKDHMAKASRFLQTELSSTHLSILLLLLSSMFSTD